MVVCVHLMLCPKVPSLHPSLVYSLVPRFYGYVNAREALRIRKDSGASKPWSSDPIRA